jgi:hypothetical protein
MILFCEADESTMYALHVDHQLWQAGGSTSEYGIGRDDVLVGEALLRRMRP